MIVICFEYIIERVTKEIHYHTIVTVKFKFIIPKSDKIVPILYK